MISVADVKVWQSEELIRDSYADLVPIRCRGRALIAALHLLLCTLEQVQWSRDNYSDVWPRGRLSFLSSWWVWRFLATENIAPYVQ